MREKIKFHSKQSTEKSVHNKYCVCFIMFGCMYFEGRKWNEQQTSSWAPNGHEEKLLKENEKLSVARINETVEFACWAIFFYFARAQYNNFSLSAHSTVRDIDMNRMKTNTGRKM